MSTDKIIADKMREFFKNDRYAQLTDVVIEQITAERAVCTVDIQDHHLNASDRVQGGAIFTLADFTFALASNYQNFVDDNHCVTVGQSCNITFLRPAAGKKLIAKSQCIQKGRKLSVYRVTVTDDLGTNVAELTGNGYTVPMQ